MIWSKLVETNPELIDTFEDPLSQENAFDFVQKVMAATPLAPVDININSRKTVIATQATLEHHPTPRKRSLSHSDDDDVAKTSKCKKSRNDSDIVHHPPFSNDNEQLVNMICKLANSLDTMSDRLERRISDIEGNIERKLTAKFNTVITDRVQKEVKQVRDEISELKDKYEQIDKTFNEIASKKQSTTAEKSVERKFDIVVKNLPINPRENSHDTALKLNLETMVKDVLKLQNVNITSVSRKASYIEGKPGVVLVSLGDFESKQKIMKAKKLLKDKMKYRDVYIENFFNKREENARC
ncbi:unnamed protein product [Mytilus edulis]|uniref:Uncharacterized protein n=1 Tax=Mytilus edulis TaxID=6550 RepID=A0A8S3TP28_MYTED|nr:unnamed protein product [Mytilus edulis]